MSVAPKWRPIKTAPKDQQILLACLENGEDFYVCQGRWVDVPHTNEVLRVWKELGDLKSAYESTRKQDGHWQEVHIGYMEGNYGVAYEARSGRLFYPTHWMPLPKPPKSRGAWLKARKIAGQD